MKELKKNKIAVIGLGYVGLPLAVEFAKNGYNIIGFDINKSRISELQKGHEATLEVNKEEIAKEKNLSFTSNPKDIETCNIYIVTVPTPIDIYKKPDLTPLISASKTIGSLLKKDDIVIYESTVYPGCTEEDCVPVLEKTSGLKFNIDFYCGYSPERINPGDKERRVNNIIKVTSGSTVEIAEIVDDLYRSIIKAGTHKVSCLKVAEAAKVIENSQRDLNIAFVNELALIFEKMNIDTLEVLEAAGTKWNFLSFRPGLVGGHCIGVDPYYLTHKAESLGYLPQVILSGRRINDNMGIYIAGKVVKLMAKKGDGIQNAKVLVLGITFKENCPDIRNSRVIDIIEELKDFGIDVDVYDPYANKEEVISEYNIQLKDEINQKYDAVILAVAHKNFASLDWESIKKDTGIIYDVKGVLNKELATSRL